MIDSKIAFIQGRLCDMVDGKIQAFPWNHWRDEFPAAVEIGINMIEWTLDQDRLYENPFMNSEGQKEILDLCEKYNFSIPSLTGDCFMQAPFYKEGYDSNSLLKDFDNIIKACSILGVKYIVFPLVDNGSITTIKEEKEFLSGMLERVSLLEESNVQIVFESDFPPVKLKELIAKLPAKHFGINYDSGNSAALGFNVDAEFKAYGDRVYNLHIKDRLFNDTTVPLTEGDVEFKKLFHALEKVSYNGNIVFQTARSPKGKDSEFLLKYINFIKENYNYGIKS